MTNTLANEITSAPPEEANSGELRITQDRLGRTHHHGARGRFVRQNGKVDPVIAARLEGQRLLPNVDQRSAQYQRYKVIIEQMVVDAGGGGGLTEARKQLIRRFAAGSVLAEQLEVRIAKGELVSVQDYSSLSSTLVRLATRVGLNRTSKNVTPSIASYIEHINERDKEAAE